MLCKYFVFVLHLHYDILYCIGNCLCIFNSLMFNLVTYLPQKKKKHLYRVSGNYRHHQLEYFLYKYKHLISHIPDSTHRSVCPSHNFSRPPCQLVVLSLVHCEEMVCPLAHSRGGDGWKAHTTPRGLVWAGADRCWVGRGAARVWFGVNDTF